MIRTNQRMTTSELNSEWTLSKGQRTLISMCLRRIHQLALALQREFSQHLIKLVIRVTCSSIRQAKKNPYLTALQKKKCLTWALEHRDWVQRQWDTVIYSR